MNVDLIKSLSRHGALQSHHIDKIMDSDNEEAIKVALKDKNATEHNLNKAISHSDHGVRKAALSNPNITPKQVDSMYEKEHGNYVRVAVLSHPKLSRENIQKSIDSNEKAVMHNSKLSDDDIRRGLRNPKLVDETSRTDKFHGNPEYLKHMMRDDADDNMKIHAAKHWQAEHEDLEKLYHNPKTPMIAKLNVLSNYKTQDDLIKKELNHPDEIIRAYATNAAKKRHLTT